MDFPGHRCGRKSLPHLALLLAAALAGQLSGSPAAGQQHPARPAVSDGAPIQASLLDSAKKLVQSGDPQGAISLLETADLHGPNASEIHALRGLCFALLARPVESASEFDAAIALRPTYAPTYFSAGLAFASFDNLDRALDCLARALKLDPSLPGLRYNYALVLARSGHYAESEQQVQIELDNPHPHRGAESVLDLWRLKARDAYAQKKWPQTLEAYRKLLERDPEWPEAYGAIAEALFSLDRSVESLPMLKKSEALDPDNATTHTLLGKLYLDAGKQSMALAEFESALRLRPNDQEVLFRLNRIYSHNGDVANADRTLKLLKDLIAAKSSESMGEAAAAPLNGEGLEMEKRGDLAGALGQFDLAAGADPTNLIFQRNAALVLCKLGRMDEAIRRLRNILELDPDDAQTLQILAVAKEYEQKRGGRAPNLPSLEAVR